MYDKYIGQVHSMSRRKLKKLLKQIKHEKKQVHSEHHQALLSELKQSAKKALKLSK
jgi:hypothetical protein